MLERINAAIAREDRMEAVEELKTLVEDWKGHRIEGFGDLLLYGQYTVLKGDGMNGKQERIPQARFRESLPRVAPVMSTFWPASEKRWEAGTAGVGSMARIGLYALCATASSVLATAPRTMVANTWRWPWRDCGSLNGQPERAFRKGRE